MIRNIETPESKLQTKKQKYNHSEEWLKLKLFTLLTIIGKIPYFGLELCKTNKELLMTWLDNYYSAMRQHAFSQVKNTIHTTMDKDNYDFSYEKIKQIVIDLETDYAKELPELGIEDDTSIAIFTKNQVQWLNNNFRWSA